MNTAMSAYGRRGNVRGVDAGVRRVSATFGKKLRQTSSDKAAGTFAVESDTEVVMAHVLDLDPTVKSFKPQPYTVDLAKKRIVTDPEERKGLLLGNRALGHSQIYTPDFAVQLHESNAQVAIEVKHADYPPNEAMCHKLSEAAAILSNHGIEFQQAVLGNPIDTPLIENVSLLRGCKDYRSLLPHDDVLADIQSHCEHYQSPATNLIAKFDLSFHQLLCLTYFGVLGFDLMNQPLRLETIFTPAYGDLSHLELLRRLPNA